MPKTEQRRTLESHLLKL